MMFEQKYLSTFMGNQSCSPKHGYYLKFLVPGTHSSYEYMIREVKGHLNNLLAFILAVFTIPRR